MKTQSHIIFYEHHTHRHSNITYQSREEGEWSYLCLISEVSLRREKTSRSSKINVQIRASFVESAKEIDSFSLNLVTEKPIRNYSDVVESELEKCFSVDFCGLIYFLKKTVHHVHMMFMMNFGGFFFEYLIQMFEEREGYWCFCVFMILEENECSSWSWEFWWFFLLFDSGNWKEKVN